MHSEGTSVFDLSPSEKLQLVEDLWDDLAATPEAVPVHDWQKDELAAAEVQPAQEPGVGSNLARGPTPGAEPPWPLIVVIPDCEITPHSEHPWPASEIP